jgi:predicted kinase
VLGDIGFLAMDLERLGRPDLATAFLDAYREFSADSWPASLAHHHIAYRAQVRALVAALRAEQGRRASVPEARQLLTLAAAHLEAGRVRLVVVGGLPGTGKTTLAAGIAEVIGAVVLRTDEIRKERAGLDATTPAPAAPGEGLYRWEVTQATYAEMLDRARTCLSGGESVVLDATFTDPTWRDAARAVASETTADLDELRCVAPMATMQSRIERRAATGRDASDATTAVVLELTRQEVPWPTATVVHTDKAVETVLSDAFDRLGVRREAT